MNCNTISSVVAGDPVSIKTCIYACRLVRIKALVIQKKNCLWWPENKLLQEKIRFLLCLLGCQQPEALPTQHIIAMLLSGLGTNRSLNAATGQMCFSDKVAFLPHVCACSKMPCGRGQRQKYFFVLFLHMCIRNGQYPPISSCFSQDLQITLDF